MRDTRKWLVEAEADLRAAMDSLKDGHFNWCCFQSQQAAEKALKAFLTSQGRRAILTHSVI
ncbi:MAG: HEPN domain-containing protein, partial [Candidatus Brocadiaceae bacterium]|nr:HEPN domain-containing protein [Candidatus Brocadiaceae bacterium]